MTLRISCASAGRSVEEEEEEGATSVRWDIAMLPVLKWSCCGRDGDSETTGQHCRDGKRRADTGNAGCPTESVKQLA